MSGPQPTPGQWYQPGQGGYNNSGFSNPPGHQNQSVGGPGPGSVTAATVSPNYMGGVNPGADPHWATGDENHPHPGGSWWSNKEKLRWGFSLSFTWFILGNLHYKYAVPFYYIIWKAIFG